MNEAELAECHAALGVSAGVTLEELERVFMKKNFALIKGKSGAADEVNPALDAQRAGLRAAYEKLAEHLREKQRQAEAAAARKRPTLPAPPMAAKAAQTRPPMTPLTAPPMVVGAGVPSPRGELRDGGVPPPRSSRDPADDEFILFRFDNWKVNVLGPPLLLAFVLLVNVSPLGFFLKGFHVWMHEFGHATAAWLCGFRATPLPLGWTPVEPVYSPFVYWGLLLLFVILFVAGWMERKGWALGASYIDTNRDLTGGVAGSSGRNIGDGTVVLSIGKTF